ncbi:MAG: hypothetical protein U5J98_06125 [Halobacteriales archaeon]|nr:hypothetical protein [Halobacteriales archaeon]
MPGNFGDEFRDAMAASEFTEFEVLRQRVGNRLYLVTRVSDPSAQRAVLLAGTVDLTQASALIEAAAAEGRMYTHVQRLDQTHLGSFRHDDPSLFFDELG